MNQPKEGNSLQEEEEFDDTEAAVDAVSTEPAETAEPIGDAAKTEAGDSVGAEQEATDPLEAQMAETARWKDLALRSQADLDNYRKRIERDQAENVVRASQRLVELLLPALDSFDAAIATDAQTDTEAKMLEGMTGTRSQLTDALVHEGVEPIDAVGHAFDPALHEAVSVIPGEGEQIVQQELRKGYTMRGRVIRPSLVVVGHA